MRLAILSREPRSYSTQRLKTAAIEAGHQVRILDTLRFAIDLSGDEPDLHYSGNQLSDYDAVLPRVGSSVSGTVGTNCTHIRFSLVIELGCPPPRSCGTEPTSFPL